MSSERMAAESQIAVLIDFENVGLSSVQNLFDQLSDVGRVIIKRAYADWSNSKVSREQLFELGIEPILIFRSTSGGKNSSDIRLTIDATELLFQSTIDIFAIVSSDTDFIPLVNKLRSAGKVVIGAGRRETASANFVKSCDRYIYLEKSGANIVPHGKDGSSIDALLLRGVNASADEFGQVTGSKLHSTLQRLDPSFNYKSYGFSTFVKLLESSPVVKVTRPENISDVIIEQGETAGLPIAPPKKRRSRPRRKKPESAPKVETAQKPETVQKPPDIAALIHDAWSKRAPEPGRTISGPAAASEAAKVLGVQKLSLSQYKTLQILLDVNPSLTGNWERKGNVIIRIAAP